MRVLDQGGDAGAGYAATSAASARRRSRSVSALRTLMFLPVEPRLGYGSVSRAIFFYVPGRDPAAGLVRCESAGDTACCRRRIYMMRAIMSCPHVLPTGLPSRSSSQEAPIVTAERHRSSQQRGTDRHSREAAPASNLKSDGYKIRIYYDPV